MDERSEIVNDLGPSLGKSGLWRCLAVESDVFAAKYWGKQPLLSKAAELKSSNSYKAFEDLLNLDDVASILSDRRLYPELLRLAKDGMAVPREEYARVADAPADAGKVMSCFAEGATIILQDLECLWQPISRFMGQLESDIGRRPKVDAFVTPASSRGLYPHYDTHDTVLLQCSGRKQWKVYDPVTEHPFPDTEFDERVCRPTSVPVIEAVLDPGDSLYLPRGWIHEGNNLDQEPSLHMTVGIQPATRYDLAKSMLRSAAEITELRASLPFRLDLTNSDTLSPYVRDTVDILRQWFDSMDISKVRLPARVAQINELKQVQAADRLTSETFVVPRSGLQWQIRPTLDEHKFELQFDGGKLAIPRSCEAATREVLTAPRTKLSELPGLPANSSLVLVRRFVHYGLVVPAMDAHVTASPEIVGG
jgi:ribosomal protein L16 Arg81 hydroxylase